jgi:hypothetical protein
MREKRPAFRGVRRVSPGPKGDVSPDRESQSIHASCQFSRAAIRVNANVAEVTIEARFKESPGGFFQRRASATKSVDLAVHVSGDLQIVPAGLPGLTAYLFLIIVYGLTAYLFLILLYGLTVYLLLVLVYGLTAYSIALRTSPADADTASASRL